MRIVPAHGAECWPLSVYEVRRGGEGETTMRTADRRWPAILKGTRTLQAVAPTLFLLYFKLFQTLLNS